MSIERWLHMSRRSLLTVRRVSFIVAVLLLLMLPSAIFLHGLEIILLVMFCVIVTSVAYFKVFRIIGRHQQQIQASMSFQNVAQPAFNFVKYKKSVYTILYIACILCRVCAFYYNDRLNILCSGKTFYDGITFCYIYIVDVFGFIDESSDRLVENERHSR